MDTTKISSTFTVRQYREHRDNGNREAIADLIFERLYERYLEPFKNNPAKHGFSMMASGCLMTEAFYCYKKGRKKTGVAGGVAFEEFFTESTYLKPFLGYGNEFYKNIRCGILHQGETYDGWKVVRKGSLFQKSTKTINATKYLEALESELKGFVSELKEEPISSRAWKAIIKKLDHICDNCDA
ncbi:hypothetical protein [Thiolapillus brandeum]|uniref:Uncharacterized protein n=1 Tax=Thiolapillus brandeum TaxID=1076588 RepID=A0A7U6GHV0_9GAMM|nr:hypothetical protein [Thiolapillus brandeum]BAO43887.1 conserved hypothetical protein [Thiolapillus brandeum]